MCLSRMFSIKRALELRKSLEKLYSKLDEALSKIDEVSKKIEETSTQRVVRIQDLEKPTENVDFTYISIVREVVSEVKLLVSLFDKRDYVDKALFIATNRGLPGRLLLRAVAPCKWYSVYHYTSQSDYPLRVLKSLDRGNYVILYNNPLNKDSAKLILAGICGSTIYANALLNYEDFYDPYSPPLRARPCCTDTTFTKGKFGYDTTVGAQPQVVLLPPSILTESASSHVGLVVVMESEIVEHEENDGVVIEPKIGSGITWGAFDFAHSNDDNVKSGLRRASNKFVIVVKQGDYSTRESISKEVENALSKNMFVKVFESIVDRDKVKEIHTELKKRGHDFIAGIDDLWYLLTESEDVAPLAIADFYYGNVCELGRLKLDEIPNIEETLKTLMCKLQKSRVSTSIKEKHVEKLRRVMKIG